MQLAGADCAICKKNVLLDADATWCARCASVLHLECLNKASGICPSCQQAYSPPEGKFVFSHVCPECFRPTSPPEPSCMGCHARTRWDTQPDYDNFVAHMKDASQVCLLRGSAELIGAGLCLLALLLMFLIGRRPALFPLGLLVLGFMTLTPKGILSLARSRKIARFR